MPASRQGNDRETDARGKTVTTVTDANAGTVSSVTDPLGRTVTYTYDSRRRMTETRTEVTEGAGTKVYLSKNVYTADRLTETSHNTVEDTIPGAGAVDTTVRYQFGYDEADRPTTVHVGNRQLSENAYNPDGTLQEVTYGNGAEVSYEYDGYKRLMEVRYGTETAPRYRYEYLANGRVGRVYDAKLERVAMLLE